MRLAVVGDGPPNAALADAGAVAVAPDEAGDADAVVAVGESALREVALGDAFDGPLLPVDCGTPWSVPHRALDEAVSSLVAGEYRAVSHPLLAASVAGEDVGRALMDAMLVTSEPAHISGYGVAERRRGVRFPAETPPAEAWETVDEFRADGVVVATPLGSTAYARSAGGAVVGAEAGVAVVPVSPYATRADSWVLQPPLRLTVERDDAPVSLVLDDDVVSEVDPFVAVDVTFEGSVTLLVE